MNKQMQVTLGFILGGLTLGAFYTNCSGVGSNNSTSGIAASTSAAVSTGQLVLSPASVIIAPSTTTAFTATGGTGVYTYTVVSGIGSITSTSGLYTAPSTTGYAEIEVSDSNGNVAYSALTVATSTGTGSIVSVCSTPGTCGSAVGMPRELDAENLGGSYNNGLTNATQVCVKMGYSQLANYQTQTHTISCGGSYGLAEWNGSSFNWANYQICAYHQVTVVSAIACEQ